MSGSAHLIFVHHANQFLVTDGYGNRDGITRIAEGYERVLRRHEHLGVPAGLHLSGTTLEALAWYRPRTLDLVRSLIEKDVICMVGGTYAENVMTEWSADFNRRQLVELFALYADLLDCPSETVGTFWLPERVWAEDLAEVLTDPSLPNGGYRALLLDDRLLLSPEPEYMQSPRARFDATGPYENTRAFASPRTAPPTQCRIDGPSGLIVVPISADLRYWVPPRGERDWARIVRRCKESRGRQLVFADDLERTAGVGGWTDHGHSFAELLEWVASDSSPVTARRVDEVLASPVILPIKHVHRGTFYELEREWGAGEDYRGWTGSRSWAPYKRIYERTNGAVRGTDVGADERLMDLAWKHLLASSHETGWHDPVPGLARRGPAPWAKALASHSRAALVMVDAAQRLPLATAPAAEIVDVDEDGDREVVLCSGECYAVITPRFGGRLVYMFHGTRAGYVLSVGNPTDHWNFQVGVNRYMDHPPNHPCGFADAGGENDAYEVGGLLATNDAAGVALVNRGTGALRGMRKSFLLLGSPPGIVVCYRPRGVRRVVSQTCLSPDYCSLLRRGRRDLHERSGSTWTALTNRDVTVWLGTARDEAVPETCRGQHDVGHGISYALRSDAAHFHVAIGWTRVTDEACRALLDAGMECIHRLPEGIDRYELETVN